LPVSTLTIGSCKIRQKSDKIEFEGKLEGASVGINLAGTASRINAPNTDFNCKPGQKFKTETGKIFYEYEILIPWSKVQTTLALPGKSPVKLQGYGMLDHYRSVGNPRDLSRGWMTFRGCREGNRFLANFRIPPVKNAPAVGWIWNEGSLAPIGMKGLRIATQMHKAGGKEVKVPFISAPDSSFCINAGEQLYRYSFIDELGPFLGYVVKLIVGNPVTRYYDAQAQLGPDKKSFQGVLEILAIE
jgi:hypothetical protein